MRDRGAPQLDPEALTAINDVGNATLGYTGKGVKVAFLADGLQINVRGLPPQPALRVGGSPTGSRVITSYQDFSGDGTAAATSGGEAFLDASSIAAQGNAIYDLNRYASAAHPLPRGCDVRIVGAAPGATVDALKIFGSASDTTGSGFIQAINYAVTHGVSVINESFGSNGFPDEATDIVKAADDAAVAAGVTVVASSGDAGVNSTIGSPATDPSVIGVGASTTFRAYQQDYFGGINLPGQHDRYVDDNISALSSGGVAQDGKTVDLVAPGDLNWALCSASPAYQDCAGLPFQLTGGTSESSPLTAGAAADVIEAYRASHHGTTPSPAIVKQILTSTGSDVHAPGDQQGAGLLDVGAAVRLALSMPGTTRAARPGGLLVSAGQLDLSGQPSAAVMSTVSLTNTSTSAVHVSVTTRGLEPFRVAKGHVTLDPSVRSRQPRLVIWSGAREVYQTATLRVLPRHVARPARRPGTGTRTRARWCTWPSSRRRASSRATPTPRASATTPTSRWRTQHPVRGRRPSSRSGTATARGRPARPDPSRTRSRVEVAWRRLGDARRCCRSAQGRRARSRSTARCPRRPVTRPRRSCCAPSQRTSRRARPPSSRRPRSRSSSGRWSRSA